MQLRTVWRGVGVLRVAAALSLGLVIGGSQLALASHDDEFEGTVIAVNGELNIVLLQADDGTLQGVIVPDGSDFEVGTRLEVKGDLDENNALVADEIEIEDPNNPDNEANDFNDDNDDGEIEIEGRVIAVNGNIALVEDEDGDIQGVILPDGTVAAPGMKLEAEGEFNSDGAFVASKVELKGGDDDDNQDNLDNTTEGEFDVEGVVVSQDEDTVVVRDENGQEHSVKLPDGVQLPPGAKVELEGNTDADGNLVADKVELDLRDQDDDDDNDNGNGFPGGGDNDDDFGDDDNGLPGGGDNEDDDDFGDDDNAGPGGGDDDDNGNSGPGGGENDDDDDNAGPGGGGDNGGFDDEDDDDNGGFDDDDDDDGGFGDDNGGGDDDDDDGDDD